MPNAPKTPTRTIRVNDELWTAAQTKAKLDGVTVTSILIKALFDYVAGSQEPANTDED